MLNDTSAVIARVVQDLGLTAPAADDILLAVWEKQLVPFLPLPPPNSQLSAWRDPFIVGRPWDIGQNGEWSMIIGAGVKDTAGSALLYKSKNLSHGEESALVLTFVSVYLVCVCHHSVSQGLDVTSSAWRFDTNWRVSR